MPLTDDETDQKHFFYFLGFGMIFHGTMNDGCGSLIGVDVFVSPPTKYQLLYNFAQTPSRSQSSFHFHYNWTTHARRKEQV